ncbi:MAG: hypothetical protein KC589_08915 [Nanoarchaeota archaeon]|nr:hypothetical protein [Nanoarchaeota archaeon]
MNIPGQIDDIILEYITQGIEGKSLILLFAISYVYKLRVDNSNNECLIRDYQIIFKKILPILRKVIDDEMLKESDKKILNSCYEKVLDITLEK